MLNKFFAGLLPRIIVAIGLGILFGQFLPTWGVRPFVTFNATFAQLLGFMIPLIIVGLVAPAIGDVGRSAGRLLLVTVAIGYLDTVVAGMLTYGVGSYVFPQLVGQVAGTLTPAASEALEPYFVITMPPLFDVMSALVFSFLVGLGIAYVPEVNVLRDVAREFRNVMGRVISYVIIPLLPLYIFGVFLAMTVSGEAYHIIMVFAKIIAVIFVLHIFVLLYEFSVAGAIVRRNPLRLLWNMLPAYMTALGTSSSAATIPVTLRQTQKNGVSPDIAGFTIPLCATIHMSGSILKITGLALAICMIDGMPHNPLLFLNFVLMIGIVAVAAPGVPGGCIMASLGILASILGFSPEQQALMIAVYVAIDSFGTACNVTGDGAIAMVIDKFYRK